MPKVGVEGFSTGDGEKHGPKSQEPNQPVAREKRYAVDRTECLQHGDVLGNVPESGGGDGQKPDERDWTKERGNTGCASRLHREQGDENKHRQRHHIKLKAGSCDFEAFNCRQHRDCRREHGIAIE